MKYRRWAWGAAGLGGFAVALWLLAPRAPSEGGPREGAPSPALALADISGQTASLAQYRGRVVLLDFWATWCDTCMEELPDLKRLHARFRGRGFELLAASMDEDGRRSLVPFVARYGIPWRVLLSDTDSARAYGVFGLPTKYLIGPDGVVARKYIGPVDFAELERDVSALLRSAPGAKAQPKENKNS